jgi:CTP synthase
VLRDQGLDREVLRMLDIDSRGSDFTEWENMVDVLRDPQKEVEIALVGKYIDLQDAYKSKYEALTHGGVANRCKVKVRRIGAERIEDEGPERLLDGVSGVLVASGFGERGIEGKVAASKWARTRNVPYFGVCLGMQTASIEIARNVLGLKDAHSTEFSRTTTNPVIDLLASQTTVTDKGGTMRLGSYPCNVRAGSLCHRLYGRTEIHERHRHRYEFNNEYRAAFEAAGVVFSGLSPDGKLVEMMELRDHPFYVGTQFHPEFRSRPTFAHPLFAGFIAAALSYQEKRGGIPAVSLR